MPQAPFSRPTVKRPLRVDTRIASFTRAASSTRQGLKDIDLACRGDRIAQMHAILDARAIDDDRHVLAQCRLIVEHIAAGAIVDGENALKHLAHGPAFRLARRAIHMAPEIGCEDDLCHSPNLPQETEKVQPDTPWRDGVAACMTNH